MSDTTLSPFDRAMRILRAIQEETYFYGPGMASNQIEDALEAVEEMGQTLDALRTWMLQEPHLMMAYREYLAKIDATKGR